MSTLSFLKKKGFNPANFKNQEAVWLAEQAAEAERKKVAELQKQLDEERQVEVRPFLSQLPGASEVAFPGRRGGKRDCAGRKMAPIAVPMRGR